MPLELPVPTGYSSAVYGSLYLELPRKLLLNVTQMFGNSTFQAEGLNSLGVQARIWPAVHKFLTPLKVAHHTASFTHNQHASSNIPGL